MIANFLAVCLSSSAHIILNGSAWIMLASADRWCGHDRASYFTVKPKTLGRTHGSSLNSGIEAESVLWFQLLKRATWACSIPLLCHQSLLCPMPFFIVLTEAFLVSDQALETPRIFIHLHVVGNPSIDS